MPEDPANSSVLQEFVKYCEENPTGRFWQNLRNWSGFSFIIASNDWDPYDPNIAPETFDTFYWEGRDR